MKKNNILMYCHGGSGNHGCEAIVRSTVSIMECQDKYEYYLISRNRQEDHKYGINEMVNVLPEFSSVELNDKGFIYAYLKQKIFKDHKQMNKISFTKSYNVPYGQTVSLSIGGDNFCYDGYKQYIDYHKISKSKGHKTVLWGCSIEAKYLENKDLIDDLKEYDKILVRESLSFNAMKEKGLKNIYLYPDPAFTLEKEYDKNLDVKENTVGINISPMIFDYGNVNSKIYENYIYLIRYILDNTDMNIMLIPHVVWEHNNDLNVLKKIKKEFDKENRVYIFKDCNCKQLKYVISKLRFLVAARTHASIAAYSSLIPTLVVGYSIKSRGIALDIFGTEKNYVVSVENMERQSELTEAFQWIYDHEEKIKEHLSKFMPGYINKAYEAGKEIRSLFVDEYKYLKTKIRMDDCVGCSACVNECPKKCLTMKKNSEGFNYPEYDKSQCINCHRCEQVCPINKEFQKNFPIQTLAVINKNENIRLKSSSGGVFYSLANNFLEDGGIVYGAAFDDDYSVKHIRVAPKEKNNLYRLMGAKYSESKIGDNYIKIKSDLKENKKVLFSGTPCQISGLYSYLGVTYENLFTIDIICHGVPSPKVWRSYLNGIIKKNNQTLTNVNFRAKDTGWSKYKYSIKYEFGNKYILEENGTSPFLHGMTKDYFLRPSCYRCYFKGHYHQGDLTIGDFWGIWNIAPEIDDNKGVSALIVNSYKGQNLVNAIDDSLEIYEFTLQQIKSYNLSWSKRAIFTRYRDIFFKQLENEEVPLIISNIESSKHNREIFHSKLIHYLKIIKENKS